MSRPELYLTSMATLAVFAGAVRIFLHLSDSRYPQKRRYLRRLIPLRFQLELSILLGIASWFFSIPVSFFIGFTAPKQDVHPDDACEFNLSQIHRAIDDYRQHSPIPPEGKGSIAVLRALKRAAFRWDDEVHLCPRGDSTSKKLKEKNSSYSFLFPIDARFRRKQDVLAYCRHLHLDGSDYVRLALRYSGQIDWMPPANFHEQLRAQDAEGIAIEPPENPLAVSAILHPAFAGLFALFLVANVCTMATGAFREHMAKVHRRAVFPPKTGRKMKVKAKRGRKVRRVKFEVDPKKRKRVVRWYLP